MQLNDDQRMLRDSLAQWLKIEYQPKRSTNQGLSGGPTQAWAQFAQMGWLAALIPEDFGGLGGGAVESLVIGEAFGTALVLEPYLSTVILSAGLIELAGSSKQCMEYLPQIAAGKLTFSFAFAEPGSRFEVAEVDTIADPSGDTHLITGNKVAVWDAPVADKLIVLARIAGKAPDSRTLGLFVVDARAEGIRSEEFPMLDGRPGANLRFDSVAAEHLHGSEDPVIALVEQVVDRALVYLAAEASGAMRAATNQTIDYLKQRTQFGQPLASFQVLRHRVVDMFLQLECLQSLVMHAALSSNAGRLPQAATAAASKSLAGRLGRHIGQEAVQLHGGMGMTDELAIGHYLKRLWMLDTMLGNSAFHQRRFAELSAKQPQTGEAISC